MQHLYKTSKQMEIFLRVRGQPRVLIYLSAVPSNITDVPKLMTSRNDHQHRFFPQHNVGVIIVAMASSPNDIRLTDVDPASLPLLRANCLDPRVRGSSVVKQLTPCVLYPRYIRVYGNMPWKGRGSQAGLSDCI